MDSNVDLLAHLSEGAISRAQGIELRTTYGLFFHTRDRALEMLTAHKVVTGPHGQVVVGPGNVLRPEDEEAILRSLLGRRHCVDSALNTADVLYRRPGVLVWWLPAVKRPMHLRLHDGSYKKISTIWPNLVAAVSGRTLHMVACAGDTRPDADTVVYHAPLGNIYANTVVCTGDARLPEGASMADKAGWEAVILDSAFTHTNHGDTLADPTKGGQRKGADADFWNGRGGKNSPFPDNQLHPIGCTLGEWVASIGAGED